MNYDTQCMNYLVEFISLVHIFIVIHIYENKILLFNYI